MPRTATRTAAAVRDPLPETIAGLWSLCALMPLTSRAACDEAAALCARLAVRRLNPAQHEYFVDDAESDRGEGFARRGSVA